MQGLVDLCYVKVHRLGIEPATSNHKLNAVLLRYHTMQQTVRLHAWTVANAQGSTIYSETAAAHYENAGIKGVFERQIPNIPAKRLGTTEEVWVWCAIPFSFLPSKVIMISKMWCTPFGPSFFKSREGHLAVEIALLIVPKGSYRRWRKHVIRAEC